MGLGSTPSPNSIPKGTDAALTEEAVCQQVVHVEGLDSGTVVGIAFAAFFIGVLLTAALWFIHTHTGEYGACVVVGEHSEH